MYKLSSGCSGTNRMAVADENIQLYGKTLNEFRLNLMLTTPLSLFLEEGHVNYTILNLIQEHYLSQTQDRFRVLAEVSQIPGPKFVFAHISAPHPPFALDAQCEFYPGQVGLTAGVWTDIKGYLGRLQSVFQEMGLFSGDQSHRMIVA